jgi:uncharacterized protein YkwD
MRTITRFTTTALVLAALMANSQAQDAPVKQWVWLEKQGAWGYGYQIPDGPHKGLWRIDPGSKRTPEEVEAEAAPATDPYGFAAYLNAYRASAGLAPLEYDAELANWAAWNNAEQSGRGLGHHVHPNCLQNCAWNTPDAARTLDQWAGSRAHRENLTSPSVSRYGIAYGPGPYWTLNLR